jgi:hypothetical protein
MADPRDMNLQGELAKVMGRTPAPAPTRAPDPTVTRDSPLNHAYDHVKATLSPIVDAAKSILPSMPAQGGEQLHQDSDGKYKTNMNIADSRS